jgi:hypothetical protein
VRYKQQQLMQRKLPQVQLRQQRVRHKQQQLTQRKLQVRLQLKRVHKLPLGQLQ